MCIIIDTNVFSEVTDPTSADHNAFKAVLNWITSGDGKAVYGGSKYLKELKGNYAVLSFFVLLGRKNKTHVCDQALVDADEKRVIKLSPKGFNDQHLVAIVNISECKIICSKNTNDFSHIQNKKFYLKKKNVPKIYCKSRHSSLLTKKNIAEICQPCVKLNKKEIEALNKEVKARKKKT